LSLHYVVCLPTSRANLRENKQFAGLKAEIQIRSILQHAWAEIEHDLGYKTELSLPREIRRRFSRLAGLLELADGEFSAIRSDLTAYEAKVATDIQSEPELVPIDKASLSAYLNTSARVAKLDQAIACMCSATVDRELHPLVIEGDVAVLNFLGIRTIAALDEKLRTSEDKLLGFAREWLTEKEKVLAKAVSLLYLTYVVTGATGDAAIVRQAADILALAPESERGQTAEDVIRTYQSLTS